MFVSLSFKLKFCWYFTSHSFKIISTFLSVSFICAVKWISSRQQTQTLCSVCVSTWMWYWLIDANMLHIASLSTAFNNLPPRLIPVSCSPQMDSPERRGRVPSGPAPLSPSALLFCGYGPPPVCRPRWSGGWCGRRCRCLSESSLWTCGGSKLVADLSVLKQLVRFVCFIWILNWRDSVKMGIYVHKLIWIHVIKLTF